MAGRTLGNELSISSYVSYVYTYLSIWRGFVLCSAYPHIMIYMVKSGEELIGMAGALSVMISKNCNEIEEITAFVEFFGLMRHNLEVIRHRRLSERKGPVPPPRKPIKRCVRHGLR